MEIFLKKWAQNPTRILISAVSSIVFLILDFLDFVLCITFRFLDEFLEGKASSSCYCRREIEEGNGGGKLEGNVSGTLFERKTVFWDLGFVKRSDKFESSKNIGSGDLGKTRWSDCGCGSCVSWMNNVDQLLHVIVQETPSQAKCVASGDKPRENVIFIHGFLSSSLVWTETIFPHLSRGNYRFFAIDLFGFGKSPKPRESLYTLRDHLEMIEKSVISRSQLNTFHLVAHSMGCVIALALAAKYPNSVKSITLTAPVSAQRLLSILVIFHSCNYVLNLQPYFPSSKGVDASSNALKKLAGKNLWPPLLFGVAIMSWYEHLGRLVCFVICRNHRTWEKILKLLTRKSELHFFFADIFRHTHHAAWHTMHNVLCGGAKTMDNYLETVRKAGIRVVVIQGDRDVVVPLVCSGNIKSKVPEAEVKIIPDADHNTVILGREEEFAMDLERVWVEG